VSRQSGIVTLVVLPFAALVSFQARAAEGSFTDFPFMVHCKNSGTDRAFYLAKVDPDGVVVYISPDNLAGTITLRGPAKPVGGEGAGSCAGKTLDQLRAAGQAFDLH
jgi:hypothetical protein